jgi:hypothetical protein
MLLSYFVSVPLFALQDELEDLVLIYPYIRIPFNVPRGEIGNS